MKKRTIIIFAAAILAIVAGVASMYFEYKKTIDEANDILNGVTQDQEQRPKPKVKKPVSEEVTETIKENGLTADSQQPEV